MKFFRKFFILFKFELKNLLFRKRSIFFIFFYAFYQGSFSLAMNFLQAKVNKDFPNDINVQMKALKEILTNLNLDNIYYQIVPILKIPGEFVLFQIFSLITIVSLMMYVSFDIISKDYQEENLSLIFTRTSKISYVLSKFFSHSVFYIIFYILSFVGVYFFLMEEQMTTKVLTKTCILESTSFMFFLSFVMFISSFFRSSGLAVLSVNIFSVILIMVAPELPFSPLKKDFIFEILLGRDESYRLIMDFGIYSVLFIFLTYLVCRKKEI